MAFHKSIFQYILKQCDSFVTGNMALLAGMPLSTQALNNNSGKVVKVKVEFFGVCTIGHLPTTQTPFFSNIAFTQPYSVEHLVFLALAHEPVSSRFVNCVVLADDFFA